MVQSSNMEVPRNWFEHHTAELYKEAANHVTGIPRLHPMLKQRFIYGNRRKNVRLRVLLQGLGDVLILLCQLTEAAVRFCLDHSEL